jgi:hypothetical protein
MSATSLTYLIAAVVGVFSVALWAAFVLVPAVTSYSRIWERIVAGFLSLYVLAAFVLVGAGVGAAVLYYYDEL